MKKKLIPILLTLLVWFIMFYVMLPPINPQAREFWSFAVSAVVAAVVINMWTIVKGVAFTQHDGNIKSRLSPFKWVFAVVGVLVVIYVGGSLLSSPIIRAGAYRDLLTVTDSNFKEDIHEVDFTQIPLLDKDSAAKLAERKMGSMVDMVSQYEVGDYYTQINYQDKPVRVTPLVYGSKFKWLINRNTGIPAYIKIDMTTQNAEVVKLSEGMKISPSELLNRDLYRYLRFRYPTAIFQGINFEIDDNGDPYWICPVATRRIGLFGGTDIKGAVLLNAVTGEHTYYDVADVPVWVDVVYDAGILIEQYNYYGTLVNGYLNSIFGQRGCLQSTEGYNYIALDDDVWVYTGVTSVGGDESNVGFVLMNQRTKETHYYTISGAKEISAMSSAEGQVQHLGYKATFPLLLNVGGEPTYFLALKDGAGLVKKYAMVNIEKYQIVATGDTVEQTEQEYRNLMGSNGIETTENADKKEITGIIASIKDAVIDGNTYYYIQLEQSDQLFEVLVKDYLSILKKNVGDSITIDFAEDSAKKVNQVLNLKE